MVQRGISTRIFPSLIATLFLILACPPREAFGQAITGAIEGSVLDPSGLPIPGAQVTARNDQLGTKVATQADAGGRYLFTLLPPGSYTVEAVAKGFDQQTGRGVVQVDQTVRLDFHLRTAAVKVTVEVTAAASVVETTSAEMGQVIGHNMVQGLPLNGRIFSQLVTLVPGAVPVGFSDFEENPSAAGAQTATNSSVNGVKWSGNNYLIDGVANNEPLNQYINISPPLDAIEEFKVETMNPTAEYGVFGGALVNLTTRSGTNKFHGSLFEYVRNDDMNATDFFAHTVPSLKSNEFGGSLGGPIIRDKTFFFMDAQEFTQHVAGVSIETVPSVPARVGNLSADPNIIYDPTTGLPFPGNVIPQGRLNPITAQIANLYPLPTSPGMSNNFLGFTPTISDQQSFDVRVDHYFSGNSRLFARESMQKRQFDRASPGNKFMYGGSDADSQNQNVVIGYNNLFSPNKALELRLGINRYRNVFVGPDHGIDENNILGIPNGNTLGDSYTVGLAYIGIPGYLGTGSTFVGDGSNGTHRIVTEWQYTGNYSWNVGAHALKMGADARDIKQSLFGVSAPRGEFDFDANVTSNQGAPGTGDGIASFLLGYPSTVTRGYVYHRPYVLIWNIGAFAEDTYRVNSHLTLDLGLRWDVFTPPVEKFNDQGNFDLSTGLMDLATPANRGDNVDTCHKNFAPRVGFAYTPNGGRTAIRGAFGMSYFSDNFGANGGTLEDSYPFTQTKITPNTNIFVPALNVSNGFQAYSPPVVNYTTISPPAGFAVTVIPRNFRQDTVEMFNGGIQQELAKNTVLEVAYVRTRGLHLYLNTDIDTPQPGPGSINPRRPYYGLVPDITSITLRASNGDAVYNALQIRLEKRFSFGLQALASYAYSSSRDDLNVLDNYNFSRNWGPSCCFMSDDITQNFIASYTYELPFGHGKRFANSISSMADKFIGGWSVRGITRFHSGDPLTVSVASSLLNNGGGNYANQTCSGQPDSVAEWFNTSCFSAPALYQYGNMRRGSIWGPGMNNWDLSLYKKVSLERGMSFELGADFFNAFNHPEFSDPATTFGAPGFGQITSLSIPDRQIQLSLRLAF